MASLRSERGSSGRFARRTWRSSMMTGPPSSAARSTLPKAHLRKSCSSRRPLRNTASRRTSRKSSPWSRRPKTWTWRCASWRRSAPRISTCTSAGRPNWAMPVKWKMGRVAGKKSTKSTKYAKQADCTNGTNCSNKSGRRPTDFPDATDNQSDPGIGWMRVSRSWADLLMNAADRAGFHLLGGATLGTPRIRSVWRCPGESAHGTIDRLMMPSWDARPCPINGNHLISGGICGTRKRGEPSASTALGRYQGF